jgi:hypothetical protein
LCNCVSLWQKLWDFHRHGSHIRSSKESLEPCGILRFEITSNFLGINFCVCVTCSKRVSISKGGKHFLTKSSKDWDIK